MPDPARPAILSRRRFSSYLPTVAKLQRCGRVAGQARSHEKLFQGGLDVAAEMMGSHADIFI